MMYLARGSRYGIFSKPKSSKPKCRRLFERYSTVKANNLIASHLFLQLVTLLAQNQCLSSFIIDHFSP